MSGIGVISNPRARRNRRNPGIAQGLGYVLGEKGEMVSPGDLDALAATARRFRERGIDVLCINGGDGTLHKVLTAMVQAYEDQPLPQVALLRGGTMNTIARSMGIRGKPPDILDYVVSRYHADQPLGITRRWLLEVDGEQYGFLFGTGLFARYLEAYYESDDPSPAWAAWVLGRAIASALVGGKFARHLTAQVPADVEADGRLWTRGDFRVVAAGTVAEVGLGFKPFIACRRHPEHMAALGLGCKMTAIPGLLPGIWMGRQIHHPDVDVGVHRQLVLRAREPGANKYMLDGDFYEGGQTLTLRVGPYVDFVVPEW